LSIVVPATAGPFVLQQGRPVVTRAKVEINPQTAELTIATEQIPQIIEGFPLQIQHVNVLVNRPNFTFNPTSCTPTQIAGTTVGWEGASSPLSSPFQVGDCATLKYEPKVTVSSAGHASKRSGASLKFKISYPKAAIGTQSWFKEAKFDIPQADPRETRHAPAGVPARYVRTRPQRVPHTLEDRHRDREHTRPARRAHGRCVFRPTETRSSRTS
jgi:hypothetical protein